MEIAKKEKVLVLLSGGLVSSVMLMDCVRKGYDVTAVTFIADGASAEQLKEKECARMLAAYNDVQHILVDLSSFKRVLNHVELVAKATAGEALPPAEDGEYEDEQAEAKVSKPLPIDTITGMSESLAQAIGASQTFMGQRDDSDLFELAKGLSIPMTFDWCSWKAAYEASQKATITPPAAEANNTQQA
jgi:7-cyano-7-deazaguanine synthase in queuosine biosynthesis